jgi:hypothetical protein
MALDPAYLFYSDGTITLTNGSDIATGQFTAWDPAVLPFDFVFPNDGTAGLGVIKEVLAMDQIRLAKPWTGPTLANVPYTMVRWTKHTDPRIYAVRVSDYLARLKAIPDNLEEVAADINADAAAVAAAMTALAQIQTDVDADRQAAEAAAGTASGAASTATQQASIAQQWAEAASSAVLPDNSVTNAKLADMPTARIKGRSSAGTGDPEDLTPAQARSVLQLGDLASGVNLVDLDYKYVGDIRLAASTAFTWVADAGYYKMGAPAGTGWVLTSFWQSGTTYIVAFPSGKQIQKYSHYSQTWVAVAG